jgi:hypothetical protein
VKIANQELWYHLLPKKYQHLCPGHRMSSNSIACSVTFFSRERLASKKPAAIESFGKTDKR